MKKQDFLFVFTLIVIFLPFFVSDALYDWYKSFNAAHGMIMSFVKFGVLATLGEILGLRISSGVYNRKGFGVLPRAVVWGLDRKSTRLNSSHNRESRMPSSA